MGFVVLHIDKASGNDAGMTAHIERTIDPVNADKERTHLNRELVEFPKGVDNWTQAIQHRLDTAGLTRKIGTNQVRALRIMLSGTSEDMQRIEAGDKLDQWCRDNIDWLRKTYGADNIVSAVLHMDEKTPHIHATVVPIVTGERRKATQAKPAESGKKQYKKKKYTAPRLCADDIMARNKLKEYQNTYAEAMAKYGLQRGIDGSEAKHTTNQEYCRELFVQKDELQKYVEVLREEKTEMDEKIRDLYDRRDEAREKFLNMDEYARRKEKDIVVIESRLQQLKQEYEPYKAQEELDSIHKIFPMMKEMLRITELCEQIGLAFESIRGLLSGKILTANSVKLYSPEHKQHFEAKDIRLKVEPESDNPVKLRLTINGKNIIDWFKEKSQELKQNVSVRNHIKPTQKSNMPKIKN